MKRGIQGLLEGKSEVWSVRSNAKVSQAIALMADKDIGAVVVIDLGELVGILSERDCARRLALEDRAAKETPVSELMTRDVIAIQPERTIDECMALMTAKHIRHLPVVEGNKVVGVISIGDIVRAVIQTKSTTIEQLERYIQGYA